MARHKGGTGHAKKDKPSSPRQGRHIHVLGEEFPKLHDEGWLISCSTTIIIIIIIEREKVLMPLNCNNVAQSFFIPPIAPVTRNRSGQPELNYKWAPPNPSDIQSFEHNPLAETLAICTGFTTVTGKNEREKKTNKGSDEMKPK
jgi:hypothetical protein